MMPILNAISITFTLILIWLVEPAHAHVSILFFSRTHQQDVRAGADAAYAQAQRLFAQRTPESIRQPIAKGQEALSLYEDLEDKPKQAAPLVGLPGL